jgi:hypothetical protein
MRYKHYANALQCYVICTVLNSFFYIYVRKSLRTFKARRIRKRDKQQFSAAAKVSGKLIAIRCFVVYSEGSRHDSIHIKTTM